MEFEKISKAILTYKVKKTLHHCSTGGVNSIAFVALFWKSVWCPWEHASRCPQGLRTLQFLRQMVTAKRPRSKYDGALSGRGKKQERGCCFGVQRLETPPPVFALFQESFVLLDNSGVVGCLLVYRRLGIAPPKTLIICLCSCPWGGVARTHTRFPCHPGRRGPACTWSRGPQHGDLSSLSLTAVSSSPSGFPGAHSWAPTQTCGV